MSKAKSKGLFRTLWRWGRAVNKRIDTTAEWVARHNTPKEIRRATQEWSKKANENGERLPPPEPKPPTSWQTKLTGADKEVWRATFMPGGYTVEITIWPPKDDFEVMYLAEQEVRRRFGAYTETWQCKFVEFLRAAEEQEDIVGEDETEDESAEA